MKFMTKVGLLAVAVALLAGAASAQSLGEAARQARKRKSAPSPAQKVYTNENLPTSAPISIMSGSGVNTADKPDSKADDAAAKNAGAKAAESADAKKDQEEWRARFTEQKGKIQLLQRELDVLQREAQIRAAAFYADAGTRLRDDKKFSEDERKTRADIETKQKQLTDAQQQLEDMREQARKAGMASSVTD